MENVWKWKRHKAGKLDPYMAIDSTRNQIENERDIDKNRESNGQLLHGNRQGCSLPHEAPVKQKG